jgi:hypothetical protein
LRWKCCTGALGDRQQNAQTSPNAGCDTLKGW